MFAFNNFAKYFLELFSDVLNDIKEWFIGIWTVLFKNVFENFRVYGEIISRHILKFEILDWVMFIFTMLVIFLLIFFLAVKIVLFFKKYVKFRAKEVEKEQLLEEISKLNANTIELMDEKKALLAMKVSQLGLKPGEDDTYDNVAGVHTDSKGSEGRFTKLAQVDLQYQSVDSNIHMTYDDKLALPGIIERFIAFSCSKLNLYYTKETIAYFFASMATSKVIILEGISGTGKTSLPYAMSKFFKNNASIISVQPSWRDRAELMGYLNEFTKKFNETDFLKSVYETLYRKDVNFIVLDEMNLARIEYYFAEFLSVMEMPDINEWKIDLVPDVWDNDPKLLVNGKITIPQNVWFIGTANKDDSTFTITDKVYDRAMPIEFSKKGEKFESEEANPMNMTYEYLNDLFIQAKNEYEISKTNLEKFEKLDEFMIDNFKLAFGNRILKQLHDFIPVFVACGGDELDGFDYILTRKILRKFESLNISFMKDELNQLSNLISKLFGKNKFPEAQKYIKSLQRMM